MAKKTVAKLDAELQELKKDISGVHMYRATVWHWEQVAVVFEKLTRYGELIKFEVVPGFAPGKQCWEIIAWHSTLLNEKLRHKIDSRNYYAGLEASADRYFPKKK